MPEQIPEPLRLHLSSERARHHLPESYSGLVEGVIWPLAAKIATTRTHQKTPQAPIWGVCGGQGSGKSTLVHFIKTILEHHYALPVTVLSLDDFYLPRKKREQLAREIHPLLLTRGVPGTHDTALGIEVLTRLQSASTCQDLALPAFSKALDDQLPREQWQTVQQAPGVILFEGWCVGTPPEPPRRLLSPVNGLEREEDSPGVWRSFVNQHLASDYRAWYALLDHLIYLQVPSFEQVLEWRQLQEQKLADSFRKQGLPLPERIMSESQVARFIQHYERLTRWNQASLPTISDVVLELQPDHSITEPLNFNIGRFHEHRLADTTSELSSKPEASSTASGPSS